MPKAIINKHSFFNWRFVGCSGDWESFEEAYGYSPQFLIEPEPHIQTVSWDEIFYDSGMVNTSFIENWENFDTPKNELHTYYYNDTPFLTHLKGGFSEHKMSSKDFEGELNKYFTGLNNAN